MPCNEYLMANQHITSDDINLYLLRIKSMKKDCPLRKAGLEEHDFILAVNHHRLATLVLHAIDFYVV